MNWTTRTLGEICDEGEGFIRTGPFGSQLHEADYSDEGTPVVMPKDIVEGKVSQNSIARINDEHLERLARHRLSVGDIVYGRRGDIGRQALITIKESGWLCGTGCLRISLGEAEVDPQFLHYFLRDAGVIDGITKQAIGATMPNLNTSILRSIPIRYPQITIQRRIAAILSAYDELIENNTRRLKVLEEIARRIYEEWFVRFRFPGHEGVKMVESEFGMTPDGWEVNRLGSLVKRLVAGNTYREKDVKSEGDVIVVDQSTSECLGFHTNQPDHKASTENPIIIFGDHTCKLQIMTTPFSIGANTIPFVAKDGAIYYLHNLIKGLVTTQEYKRHWTELNNKTVIKAPSNLCIQYDGVVEQFFAVMDVLRIKNRNLRRTRDLLLPKLISGEIEVSNFPEPEDL